MNLVAAVLVDVDVEAIVAAVFDLVARVRGVAVGVIEAASAARDRRVRRIGHLNFVQS